jgi:hypothetical protein
VRDVRDAMNVKEVVQWLAIAAAIGGAGITWGEMSTRSASAWVSIGKLEDQSWQCKDEIKALKSDQTLDRKIDKLSWQLQQLQETVNDLPQKKR